MRWWEILGLLARLVVGGVWVIAGALKLPDPAGSVRAVRAYELLPEAVVPLVGYALPVVEIVVGLMLIAGLLTRVAAIFSALLLLAFIIGIAAAWARGLRIDCGCFGGGGFDADATAQYPWEITRDLGLLALSVLVAAMPARLALDRVILAPAARPDLEGAARATSSKPYPDA